MRFLKQTKSFVPYSAKTLAAENNGKFGYFDYLKEKTLVYCFLVGSHYRATSQCLQQS